MKLHKLSALLFGAFLALAPVPAFAVGLAIIAGTGTGGSQIDPTFNAGSAVTSNFTSSIPSGSLVVQIMYNATSGGTSGGFTCSDSQSNSYSSGQSVAATTGAAAQICYSVTTHALTTSDTFTCTQTSGPAGVVCQAVVFSGAAASPYDTASATGSTNSGTGSTLTTGTLNGPCGAANCEVLIGVDCFLNWGTLANTSGFTDLAPLSGSRGFIASYKIVSATTATSYTVTNSASGNTAFQLQAFKAASGAPPNVCMLPIGVGGC